MDYVLDGQYARLLRNAGIDPSRLLRAAGLPGDALAGPRPVLAPAQHNALVEALSRLAGGAKGAIALAPRGRGSNASHRRSSRPTAPTTRCSALSG